MKRRSFIRQMIWAGVAPSIIIPSAEASRSLVAASSQYFQVTSTPTSNHPFTLACWVRPSSSGTVLTAMAINSSTTARIMLYRDSSNVAAAGIISDSGTSGFAYGTDPVVEGSWTHICGVYPADNNRSIFTNGTNKQTDTAARATPGLNRVIVGGRIASGAYGSFFNGQIADCVIYNRALSDAEVAQLHRGGPRSLRNGLVFWVRGTEPGNLRDIVGGRTLTAVNSPTVSDLHPRTR